VIYVALMLAAALVAVVVAFASLMRSLIRQHARERDLLTNQLLHAVGRTWSPPPADEWQPAADGEPFVREYTPQPEQWPYNAVSEG